MWPSEEESDCSDNEVALDGRNTLPLPFQQLFIFIFMWQFVYHISNSAVTCLLKFLKYFIRAIGTAFICKDLVDVTVSMPLSLQSVHHLLGVSGEAFISYVVCPSCCSVYPFEDCIVRSSCGKLESKRCHVAYPNHPHISRRRKCDALLLKIVKRKNHSFLKHLKVYPYQSLEKSISRLVMR